jgi:hypothetical protein
VIRGNYRTTNTPKSRLLIVQFTVCEVELVICKSAIIWKKYRFGTGTISYEIPVLISTHNSEYKFSGD